MAGKMNILVMVIFGDCYFGISFGASDWGRGQRGRVNLRGEQLTMYNVPPFIVVMQNSIRIIWEWRWRWLLEECEGEEVEME
jgi:hypothetical protein